jgi:elongation factor G
VSSDARRQSSTTCPAPTDIPPVKGELENGKIGERRAADDEPFAGLAFKIMTDPYVGPADLLPRLFGDRQFGRHRLQPDQGTQGALGRILQMHANQREEIKEVRAGDIAAAVGLKEATTGDTLCDPDHLITLEKMIFPSR